MFYTFMLSAAGIEEEDALMAGSSANSVALVATTISREVNVIASALHANLVRLNHLGVSMSPNAMLQAQT